LLAPATAAEIHTRHAAVVAELRPRLDLREERIGRKSELLTGFGKPVRLAQCPCASPDGVKDGATGGDDSSLGCSRRPG
jgi:hypothetical protein